MLKIENKPLRKIKVGDKIVGSDGKAVVVTHVYDSYVPDKMYEITMEDGQTIKCSANHLWYCETQTDIKEKKEYLKLAKYYFKHETIPNYDILLPAYPYSMIGTKFSNNKKCQKLIQRAALSLGPTYQVPNVIFDGTKYIREEKVYTYSFNDLIDFLKGLQHVVNQDKEQYFFFGKVRETQQIVALGDYSDVNIPELNDLNFSNK